MNHTRAGMTFWMVLTLLATCWSGAQGTETPETIKDKSGLRFAESGASRSTDADAPVVEARSNPSPAAVLRFDSHVHVGHELSWQEPPELVRQTPQSMMDSDGGLKDVLKRAAARTYAGAVAAGSWASGLAIRFVAAAKDSFASRPAAIPPSSLGPDVW